MTSNLLIIMVERTLLIPVAGVWYSISFCFAVDAGVNAVCALTSWSGYLGGRLSNGRRRSTQISPAFVPRDLTTRTELARTTGLPSIRKSSRRMLGWVWRWLFSVSRGSVESRRIKDGMRSDRTGCHQNMGISSSSFRRCLQRTVEKGTPKAKKEMRRCLRCCPLAMPSDSDECPNSQMCFFLSVFCT